MNDTSWASSSRIQAASWQAQTGKNCKRSHQICSKIGQESILEALWSGKAAVRGVHELQRGVHELQRGVHELQEGQQLRSRLALGAVSRLVLKARRGLEPFKTTLAEGANAHCFKTWSVKDVSNRIPILGGSVHPQKGIETTYNACGNLKVVKLRSC